jgi:hypothetical protein
LARLFRACRSYGVIQKIEGYEAVKGGTYFSLMVVDFLLQSFVVLLYDISAGICTRLSYALGDVYSPAAKKIVKKA